MFNGIIFATGSVISIKKNKKSKLIGVKTRLRVNKKDIGSSICCNGVCLTLAKVQKNIIFFYVSNETIKRSNFKKIQIGQLINLEKSLIYGQKISGHFTQGHVDTTAKVKLIRVIDQSWELRLKIQNNKYNKYLEENLRIY